MSQDMLTLAARCEAATGPDPKLDREILDTICEKWVGKWLLGPAKYRFTASLDAAMTLCRNKSEAMAVLRALLAALGNDIIAIEDLPRLACAAALRARASQGKD